MLMFYVALLHLFGFEPPLEVVAQLLWIILFELIEQRLRSIEYFLQQINAANLQQGQVNDAYLKIDKAAAFLSTTPNALLVMVSKGQVPSIKKQGKLYFRRNDLVEWLETTIL